jgi:hypothetical protein
LDEAEGLEEEADWRGNEEKERGKLEHLIPDVVWRRVASLSQAVDQAARV